MIVGLSLFLTFFVMGPTLDRVYAESYLPYSKNSIAFEEALGKAEEPMRQFMAKQTRQSDMALFVLADGWNLLVGSLAASFVT